MKYKLPSKIFDSHFVRKNGRSLPKKSLEFIALLLAMNFVAIQG